MHVGKSRDLAALKRKLYGNHYVISFLDGFRLRLYYNDAFVLDNELGIILPEILTVEQSSYSEYSGSGRAGFGVVIRNSLSFLFVSPALMLDSIAYLASEMAYIRYKTGHKFLLAAYKMKSINAFMKTKKYKKLYNSDPKIRDIASNAIFELAYAAGDTDSKSHNLVSRIMSENVETVVI